MTDRTQRRVEALEERVATLETRLIGAAEQSISSQLHPVPPVPIILSCPQCHARHIDRGEFATKHHHTHSCQACGACWRPAVVATVGVQYLPGFKDPTP